MKRPLTKWLVFLTSSVLTLAVVHCFCWTATIADTCPPLEGDREACCCGMQEGPRIEARDLSPAVLHKGVDRPDKLASFGGDEASAVTGTVKVWDSVPNVAAAHPPAVPGYILNATFLN